MKWTIAQIGTNRLQRVLVSDKEQNPNKILDALKYDLKTVLDNYLDEYNLDISVSEQNNMFNFDIKVDAERIKTFATLPSN